MVHLDDDARRFVPQDRRRQRRVHPVDLRDIGVAHPAPRDLDAHLAVHVGGSFHTARAAWPHMAGQKYGRIINIGSTAGEFPYPGGNVYGASKAAGEAVVVGVVRLRCEPPVGLDLAERVRRREAEQVGRDDLDLLGQVDVVDLVPGGLLPGKGLQRPRVGNFSSSTLCIASVPPRSFSEKPMFCATVICGNRLKL